MTDGDDDGARSAAFSQYGGAAFAAAMNGAYGSIPDPIGTGVDPKKMQDFVKKLHSCAILPWSFSRRWGVYQIFLDIDWDDFGGLEKWALDAWKARSNLSIQSNSLYVFADAPIESPYNVMPRVKAGLLDALVKVCLELPAANQPARMPGIPIRIHVGQKCRDSQNPQNHDIDFSWCFESAKPRSIETILMLKLTMICPFNS